MLNQKVIMRPVAGNQLFLCDSLPDTRHNAIRDSAAINYMREAKRCSICHETVPSV